MDTDIDQLDPTRPFLTSTLMAQRLSQRQFLLSLPDSTVRRARLHPRPAEVNDVADIEEGRLEQLVRDDIEGIRADFGDEIRQWLTELIQIDLSRKLGEAMSEYVGNGNDSAAMARLKTFHIKRTQRFITSPSEDDVSIREPDFVSIVGLLDFADWLAKDGFRDIRDN
jgi:hypothetical protein